MTTTPNEPLEDPDVTPSGDPDASPEPVTPDPSAPVPDADPDTTPSSEPPTEL